MDLINVFKQSTHQKILLSFGQIFPTFNSGMKAFGFLCVDRNVIHIQFAETTIKPNATDNNIMQYFHMCNIILSGTGNQEQGTGNR